MKNYLTRRNNDFGFGIFDDMFDEFFKPVVYTGRHSMNTDVKKIDDGYELSIDMPGFEKENITISLSNGYLTVQAKREEKEESDKTYVRKERSFSCSRSYYVGENVTEDDVKAKYLNGTLTLIVPENKKKEIERKNIQID